MNSTLHISDSPSYCCCYYCLQMSPHCKNGLCRLQNVTKMCFNCISNIAQILIISVSSANSTPTWGVQYVLFPTKGQTKLFTLCQHFFSKLFLLDEFAADADIIQTLTNPVRMDHTTLQSINTSMRNAWFCSAPRGCIQQHSSASLPSLSRFTGDFPAVYCTQTALMNTTQAYCTANSCVIGIAMR